MNIKKRIEINFNVLFGVTIFWLDEKLHKAFLIKMVLVVFEKEERKLTKGKIKLAINLRFKRISKK